MLHADVSSCGRVGEGERRHGDWPGLVLHAAWNLGGVTVQEGQRFLHCKNESGVSEEREGFGFSFFAKHIRCFYIMTEKNFIVHLGGKLSFGAPTRRQTTEKQSTAESMKHNVAPSDNGQLVKHTQTGNMKTNKNK